MQLTLSFLFGTACDKLNVAHKQTHACMVTPYHGSLVWRRQQGNYPACACGQSLRTLWLLQYRRQVEVDVIARRQTSQSFQFHFHKFQFWFCSAAERWVSSDGGISVELTHQNTLLFLATPWSEKKKKKKLPITCQYLTSAPAWQL